MLNDVHNTWHSGLKITWKVKYFAYCVTQNKITSIKNVVVLLHNGAKKGEVGQGWKELLSDNSGVRRTSSILSKAIEIDGNL